MPHVPIKKLNKQQQKFIQNPWFNTAIQSSIQKKHKIFKKYIKCRNPVTKNNLHKEYKSYRNKFLNHKRNLKKIIISSCYRTVPSAIWEIFSDFLIFCNLFHEPLGE